MMGEREGGETDYMESTFRPGQRPLIALARSLPIIPSFSPLRCESGFLGIRRRALPEKRPCFLVESTASLRKSAIPSLPSPPPSLFFCLRERPCGKLDQVVALVVIIPKFDSLMRVYFYNFRLLIENLT